MKKICLIGLLIMAIFSLTSCEDNSYRKLFDEFYSMRFEKACHAENKMANYRGLGEYLFYVYEFSEIVDGHKFDNILGAAEIHKTEGIDRIILSETKHGENFYWGIEVIEFKTDEAAEAMLEKENIEIIRYARHKNIVYNMDFFGTTFVYGDYYVTRGPFCCSKDGEALMIYNLNNYKENVITIPNSVKYVLDFSLTGLFNITKIICGENLEKIGSHSFYGSESLEYFEANSKLKSIGSLAFSQNPKLKTVILNDGLEYIDNKAFDQCPSLEYVVIPASVKDIGYRAFSSGILYIEAESKPEKWDRSFYGGTAKVYWGNEWEYNEEGIPVVIE